VSERTASLARAVATGDGPSPGTSEGTSVASRELAQRLSGTVEVLLLWFPEVDRVEVSVRDPSTGAGFHVEVAPGSALDAFYHPYAYAARRENYDRILKTTRR
jgi:hypothetical protein